MENVMEMTQEMKNGTATGFNDPTSGYIFRGNESYDKTRQHIKSRGITLSTKFCTARLWFFR